MAIEVQQLNINKGGKQLLSDINFSFTKPAIIGIVGENGAGKSTLLNALSGLTETHQCVRINNGWIEDYPIQELADIRAVLPQSSVLNFPFAVAEVVSLGFSLSALSHQQQMDITAEALQLVEAVELAERNYTQLSGGEKQRVQMARVIAQLYKTKHQEISPEHQFLLLDEPTSALDIRHQYRILNALRNMVAEGIFIFMVIHDLNLAACYCDEIVVLKDGKLMESGSPNDILQEDVINQAFGIDVDIRFNEHMQSPFMIKR